MSKNCKSKASKGFIANYNGEAIKLGEVMVPFPYSELDAENCVNPECIKTVSVGGRQFRVIYRAVPEEWASEARSALNLVENEELGHYAVSNSVSMDAVRDEFELELGEEASAEETMLAKETRAEILETFRRLLNDLIDKAPKLGYAVLLMHTGIKGAAFYESMRLTSFPGNRMRQQAEDILVNGLMKLDIQGIKCYRSKNDAYYREEASKLLERVIELYR